MVRWILPLLTGKTDGPASQATENKLRGAAWTSAMIDARAVVKSRDES